MTFKEGQMISIHTNLQSDPTFYFGYRISSKLGALLNTYEYDNVFFVTDRKLMDLHADEIKEVFSKSNIRYKMVTALEPADDDQSNESKQETLADALMSAGVTRHSIVIGFGGTQLTKTVHLSSAMIHEGIRYIEMPTSFMNMTDGCLSERKAPLFIFADTRYLATESLKSRKASLEQRMENAATADDDMASHYANVLTGENLESMSPLTTTDTTYRVILAGIEASKQRHVAASKLELAG